MKLKMIAVGLLALSLLAIALFSTVAAQDTYSAFMDVTRRGNYLTFIVDSYGYVPYFYGYQVDKDSLVLHYIPRGETSEVAFNVPQEIVVATDYGVTFTLDRRDLVLHAADSYITGTVTIGGVTYEFYAAGPGWGWANIH